MVRNGGIWGDFYGQLRRRRTAKLPPPAAIARPAASTARSVRATWPLLDARWEGRATWCSPPSAAAVVEVDGTVTAAAGEAMVVVGAGVVGGAVGAGAARAAVTGGRAAAAGAGASVAGGCVAGGWVGGGCAPVTVTVPCMKLWMLQ